MVSSNRCSGVADGRACATEGIIDACKSLLAEHSPCSPLLAVHPRHTEAQRADVHLRMGDKSWLSSPRRQEVLASFLSRTGIAEAKAQRSGILLTFENETLRALEQRLASGEEPSIDPSGLLADARYDVSLVGPNANKALHLGHLRNIAIGQAMACSLEAAGATVQRRSLVADIGRRMCEAMAGYLEGHQGETPVSSGLCGDRFAELCSQAFRERPGSPATKSTPGPNRAEEELQADTAARLMTGWLDGGEAERNLCEQMRGWVMSGHERTLARLGVSIDVYDFESDEIARARDLIERGLLTGLFERERGGGVVYRSGRPEFATMVLLNPQGGVTECARVLAVCHRMIEELDQGVSFLEVLGDEWRPAQTVVADLLIELLPNASNRAYEWLYYGLVTAGGKKIGSSNGQVIWIDDFLDALGSSPSVASLERIGAGSVPRSELVDILARASFLCAPMAPPLPLAIESLFEEQGGPAWTIAEAWSQASAVDPDATHVHLPRAGILQAQEFPSVLARAIDRRDPTVLASFLLRLSQAYLSGPDPGSSARPVLERVLRSAGFAVSGPPASSPEALSRQPSPKPLLVEA